MAVVTQKPILMAGERRLHRAHSTQVLAIALALTVLPSLAAADGGITIGPGLDARGLVGLRYQLDTEEPSKEKTDHRFRLRGHWGLDYRATESISIFTLLTTTGDDGARDAYTDLEGLGALGIEVARAYVRWQHRAIVATAGLVPHQAGSSSVIWDPDLSPAGGSVRFSRRVGPVTFSPMAFAYLLRGDFNSKAAGVLGGELAARALVGDADVEVAAATYHLARKNALEPGSNSIDANGNLRADFEIFEGRAKVTLYQLIWLPIELSGDAFFNAGGIEGQRTAFSGGIGTSTRRAGGVARIGYRFRNIERDAVVSALTSDNYRLSTNVVGDDLVASFDYDERILLELSAFLFRDKTVDSESTPTIDESQHRYRARADLTVRF